MREESDLSRQPTPPDGLEGWLQYLLEITEKHRYERPMQFPPGLDPAEIRAALKAEFSELLSLAGLSEKRALIDDLYTPRERAMRIGTDARKARMKEKLSQKALAVKAGVSESTVKRLESDGKVSLDNLLLIASALGKQREIADLFNR